MATASEVKAGLDDTAASIRAERNALKQAKARVTAAKNNLNALTTVHADLIATINGYDAQTTDAFEQIAKAELAKLAPEYMSLRTKATAAETALAEIDFTD
jgi:predicted  nucleic acid-binding Zn-ribbon protein